ncbi:hypothetical protein [Chitinophaga rhizophila]|uniref:IrrE N-terminal-like domain-containing protein n=1 Tax=Chitinophaga rhizophila TaxID=2866212 RepID=A0ABS7G878_9BACT|nr:hypothetical protein [Chitinophaga rhizophila]MBW8683330.1 hypothetical protein [Chitinophaga rhizophila]
MKLTEQEEIHTFERCITFLNDIGIQTSYRTIDHESFLPGLLIENGSIVIDKEVLQYPGDILHEAGHIAVVPSKERKHLTEGAIIKRRNREAEEVMAIAWSYAACIYLKIDPSYVFHQDGYRGGSISIIDSCNKNEYMGMLMLQSVGMAAEAKQSADNLSYPHMEKWLRE